MAAGNCRKCDGPTSNLMSPTIAGNVVPQTTSDFMGTRDGAH
jgi:hypothetical protein